jgi:hypothetical protein
VKLKEQELRNRPTFWKNVLTNPVVLGALITAFIALNTTIVGLLTSATQRQLDIERVRLQTELDRAKFEGELILGAIRNNDPGKAATNVEFFIQSGLIQDHTGNFREFLAKQQVLFGPRPPSPMTAPR